MNKFKVSICIPAYRRVNYLTRLLNSIAVQTFKDFEVILSDDSPDDSVEQLAALYRDKFTLHYFKNTTALGTPENWNFAITKAEGEWIKLIHDDDWFETPNSLGVFVEHTKQGNRFIFSAYANVFDGSNRVDKIFVPAFWQKRIIRQPLTLLAHNVVGPPSVTMIHRSITEIYDARMKWRVDMDFYVRLLQQEKAFTYISQQLVNVGVNPQQVTNYCFENPQVELPEGFLLLTKYGADTLTNIFVYDAWWRLLRNMHITSADQLTQYEAGQWPGVITTMVKHLKRVPRRLLNIGVLSKGFMAVSFMLNGKKGIR